MHQHWAFRRQRWGTPGSSCRAPWNSHPAVGNSQDASSPLEHCYFLWSETPSPRSMTVATVGQSEPPETPRPELPASPSNTDIFSVIESSWSPPPTFKSWGIWWTSSVISLPEDSASPECPKVISSFTRAGHFGCRGWRIRLEWWRGRRLEWCGGRRLEWWGGRRLERWGGRAGSSPEFTILAQFYRRGLLNLLTRPEHALSSSCHIFTVYCHENLFELVLELECRKNKNSVCAARSASEEGSIADSSSEDEPPPPKRQKLSHNPIPDFSILFQMFTLHCLYLCKSLSYSLLGQEMRLCQSCAGNPRSANARSSQWVGCWATDHPRGDAETRGQGRKRERWCW